MQFKNPVITVYNAAMRYYCGEKDIYNHHNGRKHSRLLCGMEKQSNSKRTVDDVGNLKHANIWVEEIMGLQKDDGSAKRKVL